jgi:hypothetical protein
MNRENRILHAHRNTGIDDLLCPSLHLRIAPLDGIKIEFCIISARLNRRGRTTAEPNSHARTTQLNQECTDRNRLLVDLLLIDGTNAARKHDRLVIAPVPTGMFELKAAKVSGKVWSAKLIVKGSTTEGAFDHDREGRGHS